MVRAGWRSDRMIWKAMMPMLSKGRAIVPQTNALVRTRLAYSRLTISQTLSMAARDHFDKDIVQRRLHQLEA